jgi:hypothetical protein
MSRHDAVYIEENRYLELLRSEERVAAVEHERREEIRRAEELLQVCGANAIFSTLDGLWCKVRLDASMARLDLILKPLKSEMSLNCSQDAVKQPMRAYRWSGEYSCGLRIYRESTP